MATNIPVAFYDTCGNNFYFEMKETGLSSPRCIGQSFSDTPVLYGIFSKHQIPHFKPTDTLRQKLVHPKDKTTRDKQHNVVSAVQCSEERTDVDFGDTKQLPHKAQHRRDTSSGQDSAVHLHLKDKGHSFEDNNVQILSREDRWFERGVKEAIFVQLERLSLNRGGGLRHQISPIYNTVLRSLSRRLNTHSHQDTDADVEQDGFQASKTMPELWIQSRDSKFLISNGKEFQFKFLRGQQLLQPECKFNIRVYKDNNLEPKKGRAVMLYATKNGEQGTENKVACCREGNEIHAETMALPEEIEETKHKALFYMRENSSSPMYMFESTLYQQSFLAIEPDGRLYKLVLRQREYDQVDEQGLFSLSEPKK